MIIGIWYGESKPILSEYLVPFVEDLENILSNGIVINNCHIEVKIGQMICDTPARSFLKGGLIIISDYSNNRNFQLSELFKLKRN